MMSFHIFGLILAGTASPTPKFACFVLYLKIINSSLKYNFAFYSKLSKELKNSIYIGQVILELLI